MLGSSFSSTRPWAAVRRKDSCKVVLQGKPKEQVSEQVISLLKWSQLRCFHCIQQSTGAFVFCIISHCPFTPYQVYTLPGSTELSCILFLHKQNRVEVHISGFCLERFPCSYLSVILRKSKSNQFWEMTPHNSLFPSCFLLSCTVLCLRALLGCFPNAESSRAFPGYSSPCKAWCVQEGRMKIAAFQVWCEEKLQCRAKAADLSGRLPFINF